MEFVFRNSVGCFIGYSRDLNEIRSVLNSTLEERLNDTWTAATSANLMRLASVMGNLGEPKRFKLVQ